MTNFFLQPLSMFSSQETSLFFQGSGRSASSFFSGGHSRGVRSYRKKFLELSSDNAVATICSSENGPDMKDYAQWSSKIILLGRMWNMVDKVREIQTVALFKGGHDDLGSELINALPDKKFVAHRSVLECLIIS